MGVQMKNKGPVSKEWTAITRFKVDEKNDLPGPGVTARRFLFQCPVCQRVKIVTMVNEELGDSWLEDVDDYSESAPICDCKS